MKIHGKKGKNFIIEVTPLEMQTIQLALFEWQGVENHTSEPAREFELVRRRIHKAQDAFDSLPLVKQKTMGNTTTLTIQDHTKKDEDK